MCAVHNNRLDVVNFLLETVEDIEIDVEDLEHQTALFHAAHNGHHDVVKRLIEAGARYNLKNKVRNLTHIRNHKFWKREHKSKFVKKKPI